MATISVPGIGSGLDIDGIINSLMAVEQIPMQKLQAKQADYLAQISAYGQLRSTVASFQDAISKLKDFDDFSAVKASSGDQSVFTSSATNDALPGSYSVRVDVLAQAHKLGSSSQVDSDTTTYGNAGDSLTISTGTGDFSIEYGGMTLSEIQSAINDAADNVGVSTGIIRENDSSFYLSLSSEKTGLENSMTLSFTNSEGTPIADPLGFVETQEALDAQITIDNRYTVSSSENKITDAIQGVSIDLLSQSADAVQLTVSRDSASISSAVEGFVDAYNDLRTGIDGLRSGSLSGDGTLRLIESQIRSVLGTDVDAAGAYGYASQVGISFEKDGSLTFDSTQLSEALVDDQAAVAELFANDDQGLAFRLDGLVESMLGTDGLLDAKEDGLNASVDSTNDQMDRLNLRLELVETRYRSQFTALDTLLGQLQATSSYVTAQLSSLENLLPSNRD